MCMYSPSDSNANVCYVTSTIQLAKWRPTWNGQSEWDSTGYCTGSEITYVPISNFHI